MSFDSRGNISINTTQGWKYMVFSHSKLHIVSWQMSFNGNAFVGDERIAVRDDDGIHQPKSCVVYLYVDAAGWRDNQVGCFGKEAGGMIKKNSRTTELLPVGFQIHVLFSQDTQLDIPKPK